jgi:hypothetical protein
MPAEDNDVPVILAPFRVRSFRFQWPALLTSLAFEMETVVLSGT